MCVRAGVFVYYGVYACVRACVCVCNLVCVRAYMCVPACTCVCVWGGYKLFYTNLGEVRKTILVILGGL